ncbi:hypothetical protein MD484_g5207, partial [Candolleomyces efflorescens]
MPPKPKPKPKNKSPAPPAAAAIAPEASRPSRNTRARAQESTAGVLSDSEGLASAQPPRSSKAPTTASKQSTARHPRTSAGNSSKSSSVSTKQTKVPRRTREEAANERQAQRKEKSEIDKQFEDCWERLEEQDREAMAARTAKRVLRISDIPECDEAREGDRSPSGEEFDLNVSPTPSDAELGSHCDDTLREMEELQRRMDILKMKSASMVRSALEVSAAQHKTVNTLSIEERGLSEDHVQDVRPTSAYHANNSRVRANAPPLSARPLERNMARTNQDVSSVASAEVSTSPRVPSSEAQPPAIAKRPRHRSKKPACSSTSPNKLPPASIPAQTVQHYPSPALPTFKRIPGLTAGTVVVDHLPDFATRDGRWRMKFLPALYNLLYVSANPFSGFMLASTEFVAMVQKLINITYPEVTYTAHHKEEPFHLLAYNRINERRGAIARHAVKVVAAQVASFSKDENGDSAEGAEWLRWARRARGPLYWADPSPAWCTGPSDEAGFVPPGGRLKSRYIISMAELARTYTKGVDYNSELHRGIPIGLFSLILAGLERAARDMTSRGTLKEKAPSFSQSEWGDAVGRYTDRLNKFSSEQWDSILAVCGFTASGGVDDGLESDRSLGDHERMEMFAFASPQKRSGNMDLPGLALHDNPAIL